MTAEGATQLEEWDDPEHVPTTGVPANSVGLAIKEQREEQEEILRRFAPSPISVSFLYPATTPFTLPQFLYIRVRASARSGAIDDAEGTFSD
jgi:hypothetical protein